MLIQLDAMKGKKNMLRLASRFIVANPAEMSTTLGVE
jgi:hypothetical protein